MSHSTTRFLTMLQSLNRHDELMALADSGYAPLSRPRINAHVHLPPNFSAFETTTQACVLAAEQGVQILGGSNYYDYSVYGDLASEAEARGIFPLFGIEIIVLIDELVKAGIKINDPGNPGKMYICGKGIAKFDPMTTEARALLEVIREADSTRMSAVVDRLSAVFAAAGLDNHIDVEAVKQRIVSRHGVRYDSVYLQERHAAQAFQQVLFEKIDVESRTALLTKAFGVSPKSAPDDTVAIQNEIRSQLIKVGKPAYAPETFVDFKHAYDLILALGGIPSYPLLADGASPLCGYEESAPSLIADLTARGVYAVEFISIRNSPEVLTQYVHALRNAGFIVTAGTEHNTLDLLPIDPTCIGGVAIPDDIAEIFWEGACVVMAHQYLVMSGMLGFVDDHGEPNATYTTTEERIGAFRRLGAALFARYQERHDGTRGFEQVV